MFLIPLAPRFEERTIVVAQGLEFTNAQFRLDDNTALVVPDVVNERLQKRSLKLEVTSGTTASFYSSAQGVLYHIRLVYERTTFKEVLETPGLHVIYSGHSRIGRGPCFGMDVFRQPSDDWEDGTEDVNGLFRMGYPFMPVPVGDVHHHGYLARPVPDSESLTKADCHPMLQASFSKLKGFTTSELESSLDIKDPHHRPRWHVDDPSQLFGKFWGVDMVSVAGKVERHAVLRGGWEQTTTDPNDLGATDLKCRVLCVFACSTEMHFAKILRNRKQWTQQGDDGYGFFTTEAAYMDIAPSWIYHMLTYPKFNAGAPWKDVLDYVRGKTNQDLINAGRNYKVVSG